MTKTYEQFLNSKIKLAEKAGFTFDESQIPGIFKPHQRDITKWAIDGGRRAIFASFGLGKTFIQLAIGSIVHQHTNRPFLIGIPLGVRYEFQMDAEKLGIKIKYVRNMADVEAGNAEGIFMFLTNYERVRDGNFDASYFAGVSFDEASILRGLDTQTSDYILQHFTGIQYRFVCTATPSPNEYTEILNYAQFLGIMDRGQALTRFFQRDSQKAGNLTLYPHKAKEFWMWVSSWAVFVTKPSDLGYSDEGYDLPELIVHRHMVTAKDRGDIKDRDGNLKMFRNAAASLQDASKEKRESLPARIEKMNDIIGADGPDEHYLIWHHLEDERRAIKKAIPESKSVFGSMEQDKREEYLIGFGRGDFKYLATKPEIAGSGCNFQRFCNKAIFLGIDYKFNDFIQAVHRIHRFMQPNQVEIHLIYSDAEEQILKTLEAKWSRHNEMVAQMTSLIKEHGLSNTSMHADLSRTMGVNRKEVTGESYRCIHNDNVIEVMNMPTNSIDLTVTSIPFSDQYEYCESYHDMGHNDGNGDFFEQLGYLTPELLRVTKPGRIACIHVKDRIRYSYQNGAGMTTLEDFSGQTVAHFISHGWHLMGKITITTDVVQENNQSYRLGWSEQCKDATKMGVGLPEYVLIFRKTPTDTSNSFADVPVTKSKKDYNRARWQLDAHAYHRSNGNRLLNPDELRQMDLSTVFRLWKEKNLNEPYDFNTHLNVCGALDSVGKLSATFMSLPVHSDHPNVWTDISRMRTLNANQAKKRQEKHVCPLQFDIIDRLIERYSNPGETVLDPFGGIMSTPFRSINLNRKAIGIELNEQYWRDGVKYCRDAEAMELVPTLFDVA